MIDKKKVIEHIFVKQGDITKEETDAVVNAANPSLLGGGGVDGAIHRAAGPALLEECRKFGGCNYGEARITGGYNLKASYVIHTPGPVYRGGNNNEDEILKNSYINSMSLARDKDLKSISFPAISTGVYSYPKKEACEIALNTVIDFMAENDYLPDVYFVLFDRESLDLYNERIKKIKSSL